MRENFKALDGIRGLSAFYILVHHARLGLTQPYHEGYLKHPEQYDKLDKILVYAMGLFKFGHEAVIVFFVLSGFLISLKYAKDDFNWSEFKLLDYLKKRILRIYPTLLVSLALCVVSDYVIFLISGQRNISNYQIKNFIFNFFLIPDAPIWGYNFPVWSLKHEWFFYMLFPLLLFGSKKNFFIPVIIVFSFFISYILGWHISYIGAAAYTLMPWFFGMCLAKIYQNKNDLIKYLPLFLFFGLGYTLLDRNLNDNYPYLDSIFGLMTVGFFALLLSNKKNYLKLTLRRFSWLGAFSYSLYLLHVPIINIIRAIVIKNEANHILPYHLYYVLISILIILPIVYFIYYYTERIAINYKSKI